MIDKYTVHTRLPKELVDYFTEKARQLGISRNTLIIQALWKEKNKNEEKE